MGDEHRRHSELEEQVVDLGSDLDAQRGVEAGERFVQQQDAGMGSQRSSQGDPLLLSAGQRARSAILQATESDQVERLGDPPGPTL